MIGCCQCECVCLSCWWEHECERAHALFLWIQGLILLLCFLLLFLLVRCRCPSWKPAVQYTDNKRKLVLHIHILVANAISFTTSLPQHKEPCFATSFFLYWSHTHAHSFTNSHHPPPSQPSLLTFNLIAHWAHALASPCVIPFYEVDESQRPPRHCDCSCTSSPLPHPCSSCTQVVLSIKNLSSSFIPHQLLLPSSSVLCPFYLSPFCQRYVLSLVGCLFSHSDSFQLQRTWQKRMNSTHTNKFTLTLCSLFIVFASWIRTQLPPGCSIPVRHHHPSLSRPRLLLLISMLLSFVCFECAST